MTTTDSLFQRALANMLTEIFDGPPGQEAYLLNPGDPGLLRQLDTIEAAHARKNDYRRARRSRSLCKNKIMLLRAKGETVMNQDKNLEGVKFPPKLFWDVEYFKSNDLNFWMEAIEAIHPNGRATIFVRSIKVKLFQIAAILVFIALNLNAYSQNSTANQASVTHTTKDYDFGTSIPEGLASKEIISLLAPKADPSLTTLIGFKKWPYLQNSYMAIVCLSSNRKEYESDTLYTNGMPCCKGGYGDGSESGYNPKEVYLAMVEYSQNDKTKLKLVASYGKPLDVYTNWRNSQLDAPMYAENDSLLPYEYQGFDFAKYKVSDNEIAFGIRVNWREMYAGGGADFQAIMLFVVNGNKIINILSEPTFCSKMIAGEWNEDGTRDHDFSEGKNIIIVLPQKANNHYNLQLKEVRGKWKKVFAWSKENFRYQPLEEGTTRNQ